MKILSGTVFIAVASMSCLYGDSLVISGSCSANCNQTFYDQFGDPWSSASVSIGATSVLTGGAGAPISVQDGIQGIVETSLGLIGLYQYEHPGATGQGSDIFFTATLTIPQNISSIDVYVLNYGMTDECIHCEPSIEVSGINGFGYANGDYYEFTIPNPGTLVVTGSVNTIIQDSSDILDFGVGYDVASFSAPEPNLGPLALACLLGGVFVNFVRTRRRRSRIV